MTLFIQYSLNMCQGCLAGKMEANQDRPVRLDLLFGDCRTRTLGSHANDRAFERVVVRVHGADPALASAPIDSW
jgi:hypothetical protein